MMESSRFTRSRFLLGSLAAASSGMLTTAPALAQKSTALDRFIAAPDASYHFKLVNKLTGAGCTAYVIELTSQRWRGPAEVDRPLWKHWLTIVQPERVETKIGALIIGGGSNGDRPPDHVNSLMARFARRTHSVVSELNMVPNQPLRFADEDRTRSEDELIAYSWDKYLKTGDETWPLRLPMTKSAVRAMDTISAFCAGTLGGGVVVDRFIVGGASKRGWTTWMTAAADQRVVGIVPIVIDTLNIEPSAEHAYRAYGSWPPALRAYEEMGIMKWMGTPQMDALVKIEDPYAYRTRLTMPKLIINATGDQYFVPDSSHYYFAGLPGDKYLRYVPNADHSLAGATVDSAHSVLAFYRSIIEGTQLPTFAWQFAESGAVTVQTATAPTAVKLWYAVNPRARDFRLETIGKAFTSSELQYQGGGTYAGQITEPERGWAAYFVELTYPGVTEDTFTVTTDVQVTPNTLPFPPPHH